MRSILRSAAFRRVAAVAAAFCCAAFLLFAFIYWQTAVFETRRIDELVERQAAGIAQAPTEQMLWTLSTGIAGDLHRVTFAGLFDAGGRKLAGNLYAIPAGLPLDGRAHPLDAARLDPTRSGGEPVSAAGRLLGDGRVLVIGRTVDQLAELRAVVIRALALGVIPTLVLALGFAMLLGHRTNQRIKAVQAVLDRVRRGHLAERLPVGGGSDFDQLAAGVNHMLGELERLLNELHDVANNIAHDLRTPLSRVRAQLERARRACATREELAEAVDRAVLGLDQATGIITALLRIAEIEHSRRDAWFAPVDLAELAREVLELYGPIAEAKHVAAVLALAPAPLVHGDRDLLFEAVANLLDNAIKFTPEGGRVELALLDTEAGPLLRVSDSGPGIAPAQRARVFSRFHRLDKSRGVPGNGLGLSLVQAIVHLHGFAATIAGDQGHGCVVQLLCVASPAAGTAVAPAATPSPGRELAALQPRTA